MENVLDVLRSGINSALLGLGRATIDELTRDDVLMPGGFELVRGTRQARRWPRSGPTRHPRVGRGDVGRRARVGARRAARRHQAARAAPATGHRYRSPRHSPRDSAVPRSRPSLPYGSSGEHQAFSGKLSIAQDAVGRCLSSSCARRARPSIGCCCSAPTAATRMGGGAPALRGPRHARLVPGRACSATTRTPANRDLDDARAAARDAHPRPTAARSSATS